MLLCVDMDRVILVHTIMKSSALLGHSFLSQVFNSIACACLFPMENISTYCPTVCTDGQMLHLQSFWYFLSCLPTLMTRWWRTFRLCGLWEAALIYWSLFNCVYSKSSQWAAAENALQVGVSFHSSVLCACVCVCVCVCVWVSECVHMTSKHTYDPVVLSFLSVCR